MSRTRDEKKESRRIRHKLQRAVRRYAFSTRFKAVVTGPQLRAAAVRVTDQLLALRNPADLVPFDPEEERQAALARKAGRQ